MEEDIHSKTKKLIDDLNYFMFHVIVYFIVNLSLMVFIFSNLDQRWWMFMPGIAWAFGLVYHSLRVYGYDPFNPKKKGLKLLFSYLIKFSLG